MSLTTFPGRRAEGPRRAVVVDADEVFYGVGGYAEVADAPNIGSLTPIARVLTLSVADDLALQDGCLIILSPGIQLCKITRWLVRPAAGPTCSGHKN